MSYKITHIILLAACTYVLSLAVKDNLLLYIHPRYVFFTSSMVAICLVLSVLAFFSTKAKIRLKALISFSPIIVLLLFGLLVPATSLSSFSVSQRSSGDIGANTVTRGTNSIDLYGGSSKNLKLADWARLISRNSDPGFYTNRTVEVSGFLYDTGSSDSFQVARFVVTCCAVDAQPTGVSVYSPDWRGKYEEDQWLAIKGEIIETAVDGKKTLVIEPESIKKIAEPNNPYAN